MMTDKSPKKQIPIIQYHIQKHLEMNRMFYFNSATLWAGRVQKCCTISIYAAVTPQKVILQQLKGYTRTKVMSHTVAAGL
jgi:hypothetical protein